MRPEHRETSAIGGLLAKLTSTSRVQSLVQSPHSASAGSSPGGQGETASCSSLDNILHSTWGPWQLFSSRGQSQPIAGSAVGWDAKL